MAEKEFDLLCIGNAIVDIFITLDTSSKNSGEALDGGQFFARLGLDKSVQHIEMEKLLMILPRLPDNAPAVIGSGGGAANAAKISAFLGTKVCFIGAVGAGSANSEEYAHNTLPFPDKYGRIFQEELAAAGAELKLYLKPSPTGICLYCQSGGETRIAASPSAALELSESEISFDDIGKAKVVLIDGFMLGRQGLVRHIFELVKRSGAAAAIDLSSPAIAETYAAHIMNYANHHPLILFMNEEEALSFYSAIKNKESEIRNDKLETLNEKLEKAGNVFQALTNGKKNLIIVVKLGSRGAVCFSEGLASHAETQAVIPKESTGAGDAFCAAFLAAWIQGKTAAECAAFGNRAAKIILGITGTRISGEQFRTRLWAGLDTRGINSIRNRRY